MGCQSSPTETSWSSQSHQSNTNLHIPTHITSWHTDHGYRQHGSTYFVSPRRGVWPTVSSPSQRRPFLRLSHVRLAIGSYDATWKSRGRTRGQGCWNSSLHLPYSSTRSRPSSLVPTIITMVPASTIAHAWSVTTPYITVAAVTRSPGDSSPHRSPSDVPSVPVIGWRPQRKFTPPIAGRTGTYRSVTVVADAVDGPRGASPCPSRCAASDWRPP